MGVYSSTGQDFTAGTRAHTGLVLRALGLVTAAVCAPRAKIFPVHLAKPALQFHFLGVFDAMCVNLSYIDLADGLFALQSFDTLFEMGFSFVQAETITLAHPKATFSRQLHAH